MGGDIADLLGFVKEALLVVQQVSPHLNKLSNEVLLAPIVLERSLYLGLGNIGIAKLGVLLLELYNVRVGLFE